MSTVKNAFKRYLVVPLIGVFALGVSSPIIVLAQTHPEGPGSVRPAPKRKQNIEERMAASAIRTSPEQQQLFHQKFPRDLSVDQASPTEIRKSKVVHLKTLQERRGLSRPKVDAVLDSKKIEKPFVPKRD